MASLRSYLPPAGSTVWRNQRQARTSSSSEIENGLSRTRIKHVVIREVWKRDVPSPHAVSFRYYVFILSRFFGCIVLKRRTNLMRCLHTITRPSIDTLNSRFLSQHFRRFF